MYPFRYHQQFLYDVAFEEEEQIYCRFNCVGAKFAQAWFSATTEYNTESHFDDMGSYPTADTSFGSKFFHAVFCFKVEPSLGKLDPYIIKHTIFLDYFF